jgi:CPA2 family monovalent cation:H+ antiporter-2
MKALIESGRLHERSGQMAALVTVLEDVVVVVMLALLTSYIQFGGAEGMQIGETIGRLGAFVTLLGVGGLLLVPWMLRRMAAATNDELQTLAIAGLLCALAYFAQRAGYSLAMGSFLLGVIVAETAQRPRIERAFSGPARSSRGPLASLPHAVRSAVIVKAIGISLATERVGSMHTSGKSAAP